MARVVARVESEEKRDRTMLDSAALEFLDADGHVDVYKRQPTTWPGVILPSTPWPIRPQPG